MIGVTLILLAVADIIIVIGLFRLQRRQNANLELTRELTEERTMLSELRNQIKSELQSAQSQMRVVKDQIQVLATEAEQEVQQGVSHISTEVDSIISSLSQKFDAPLQALNEKQHFIAQLSRDLKRERELLARLVVRSEAVAKLLKSGGSWEDVVDQMEERRYADIRAMLSRGLKPERIARELGISETEVKIVSGAL